MLTCLFKAHITPHSVLAVHIPSPVGFYLKNDPGGVGTAGIDWSIILVKMAYLKILKHKFHINVQMCLRYSGQ